MHRSGDSHGAETRNSLLQLAKRGNNGNHGQEETEARDETAAPDTLAAGQSVITQVSMISS
jgi:hypothetical protein